MRTSLLWIAKAGQNRCRVLDGDLPTSRELSRHIVDERTRRASRHSHRSRMQRHVAMLYALSSQRSQRR